MSELDEVPELADLPWPEPPPPPAALSSTIVEECTRSLAPERGLSAGQRVASSMLLSLALLGGLTYLSRSDASDAVRSALFGAMGWAVVQLAVLLVGLAPPPGQRSGRRFRLAIAVIVPCLFLAYLTWSASERLPLGVFFSSGHAGGALGCGLHAVLFGALTAGGTLFLWRGTDPFSPELSGALAGLVGGLAGAAAIGVHCPSGETWHLWVGHGATVAVLTLLGWLVGRRVFSP